MGVKGGCLTSGSRSIYLFYWPNIKIMGRGWKRLDIILKIVSCYYNSGRKSIQCGLAFEEISSLYSPNLKPSQQIANDTHFGMGSKMKTVSV